MPYCKWFISSSFLLFRFWRWVVFSIGSNRCLHARNKSTLLIAYHRGKEKEEENMTINISAIFIASNILQHTTHKCLSLRGRGRRIGAYSNLHKQWTGIYALQQWSIFQLPIYNKTLHQSCKKTFARSLEIFFLNFFVFISYTLMQSAKYGWYFDWNRHNDIVIWARQLLVKIWNPSSTWHKK